MIRYRLTSPERPVTEQPADEWTEQIGNDVVVVSRIQRDVPPPRRQGRAHHVARAVTIERRHLDRDDVLDLAETPPECLVEHAPAYRRLEVEPEHGDHLGHRPRVRD